MTRKRVKRYDDGGEIVVTGQRENQVNMDMLDRLMRSRSGGGGMPNVDGGGGGGGLRYTPSRSPISAGKLGTPVGAVYGLRGIPVGGGSLALGASPRSGGKVGGSLSFPFKQGGKVKKMAKGGSTASKRADGCATKGKTKGRFV